MLPFFNLAAMVVSLLCEEKKGTALLSLGTELLNRGAEHGVCL